MSNNNPILKIGQEVLFVIGLYQKNDFKVKFVFNNRKNMLGGSFGDQIKNCTKKDAPCGASYQ
jgi:hypothetical protein